MAFTLNCNNKGCCKQMIPYLDPKDDKVYCSACDKEISNVSHFTKIQMKSIKQFKQKVSTSFAVKCEKCGKEDRPKLVNGDIACASCGGPLAKLSIAFRNMLKEKLKSIGQDI
jgi:rRNA maturation endonuclease Nob1